MPALDSTLIDLLRKGFASRLVAIEGFLVQTENFLKSVLPYLFVDMLLGLV